MSLRFGVAGDFDNDRNDEVAITPQESGSAGNDFWTNDFETDRWRSMDPDAARHPIGADLDCSGAGIPAKFGVVGDYDGDRHDEIIVAPLIGGSAGNDFWVMEFTPSNRKWRHMSPAFPPGHPLVVVDFDCTELPYPAKFGIAGDFDGNGRDEIAIAPVAGGSAGNDFWVMRFEGGSWRHMVAGHRNHPMHADLDCTGLPHPAKFSVVGDFDGDGRDELAVAPEANGSAGNDFWTMEFENGSWRHMVAGHRNHPMHADLDCTGLPHPAKFGVAGDFDGDGRDELAIAPVANGSAGNDFWTMEFENGSWRHMVAGHQNHPMHADLDCSIVPYPAVFAPAGDYDGDGRDELCISGSYSRKGSDNWVMKFDPGSRSWRQINVNSGEPLQQPRPQPRPRPRPQPQPQPQPPTTGTAYIGLQRQGFQSHIYSGESMNPLIWQNQIAEITSVKNISPVNISLAYSNRSGFRTPFWIINSQHTVNEFNGLPVEGSWTAQGGGNINTLPSGITLAVTWRRRP